MSPNEIEIENQLVLINESDLKTKFLKISEILLFSNK